MSRATQKNERFLVGRRGEPSVIIMSVKDYINTIAAAPTELKAMQERTKKIGTNKLSMRQIDDIIAQVRRDQNPKTETIKRRSKWGGH